MTSHRIINSPLNWLGSRIAATAFREHQTTPHLDIAPFSLPADGQLSSYSAKYNGKLLAPIPQWHKERQRYGVGAPPRVDWRSLRARRNLLGARAGALSGADSCTLYSAKLSNQSNFINQPHSLGPGFAGTCQVPESVSVL